MLAALIRVVPFLIVFVVFSIRVRQGRISKADLGWQRPNSWPAATGWWILFAALAVSVELVLHHYGKLELGGFKHSGFPAALRIVGMILLAPVAEELLFRGLFLSWLTRLLKKPHVAVAIQAVAFVLVHNFTYAGTFSGTVAIFQTFVDACLFAYARRSTGSIFVPMAMHITGNSIAVAEMLI